MIIICDCDETVLRFADPFQDWCESKGYITTKRLRDIHDIGDLLQVDPTKAIEMVEEFNATGILDNQPMEECAAEILPQLNRKGYRFVAVTACGTDPVFRLKRRRRLEDAFGFKWEDVHTVALGGPKTGILSMYPPSPWVEDHFGHAVDGAVLGHRSFLLTRGYNMDKHHASVQRVNSWYEIYDHLMKESA